MGVERDPPPPPPIIPMPPAYAVGCSVNAEHSDATQAEARTHAHAHAAHAHAAHHALYHNVDVRRSGNRSSTGLCGWGAAARSAELRCAAAMAHAHHPTHPHPHHALQHSQFEGEPNLAIGIASTQLDSRESESSQFSAPFPSPFRSSSWALTSPAGVASNTHKLGGCTHSILCRWTWPSAPLRRCQRCTLLTPTALHTAHPEQQPIASLACPKPPYSKPARRICPAGAAAQAQDKRRSG